MASSTSGVKPRPAGERLRSGLLTTLLLLPAGIWYLVLLVAPLVIIVVFSFGTRARNGGYAPAFVFDNYARALQKPEPFITSLQMATIGTILCLLVGLPLAYYLATRAGRYRGVLILLLVIPFWTSFLIRTYAWLLILGPDAGLAGFLESVTGAEQVQILGTPVAVMIGLVYNYLPLMVFPLFVSLDRIDRRVLEAAFDLGAGGLSVFRRVIFPQSLPGVVAGVILVGVPATGEYVIPTILGGGKSLMFGNIIANQFGSSFVWPFGAALATTLTAVLLLIIVATLQTARRTGMEQVL